MTGDTPPVEVSVIIPCYNSTGTLGLQLEALAHQVQAPPFEVIIADNGSDDGLEAFLCDWAGQLQMRYVDAGQVRGAGYARNVGMSITAADKWLFCDSDDVVARDWVSLGSLALDEVDGFGGPGAGATTEELEQGLEEAWAILDERLPAGAPLEQGRSEKWPTLLGGNSGMRRRLALEIGGYDASIPHGIEDNDLVLRLCAAGHVLAPAPGIRILYRARKSSRALFRNSRVSGEWHMALCERHGLWNSSPHLRGGGWRYEPLRCLASAIRMALHPGQRDWPGLASRAGLANGMWKGWWRFHVRKSLPKPSVGLGLDSSTTAGPGAAVSPATESDDVAWLHGRPVLVVSPHLDDALLSASEVIRRVPAEVWTVFAGDPEPIVTTSWDRSCGYSDSHALMTARLEEDHQAFAGTQATVRHLPCLDGAYTTPEQRSEDLKVLRRELSSWVEDHAEEHPVVVLPAGAGVPVTNISLPDDRVSVLARRAVDRGPLTALLQPLRDLKHRAYLRRREQARREGLVINDDHRTVRDTGIDLLRGYPQVTIVLIEELPYAWSFPADDAVQEVAAKYRLKALQKSLMVDRKWKHEHIAAYSSQLLVMDPDDRLSQVETLPTVERHWVLEDMS